MALCHDQTERYLDHKILHSRCLTVYNLFQQYKQVEISNAIFNSTYCVLSFYFRFKQQIVNPSNVLNEFALKF
jgi:hypothetical protein